MTVPVSKEEAAEKFATIPRNININEQGIYQSGCRAGFKAGAEWQAAQLQSAPKSIDEILKKYHLTKENYSDRGGSYFTVENIKAALKEYAAQSAPVSEENEYIKLNRVFYSEQMELLDKSKRKAYNLESKVYELELNVQHWKNKIQLQSQQQINLFQKKEVTLHSGDVSDFKIDCDALTDGDLECLAYLVSKQIKFGAVAGVPTGGIRFQKALEKYDLPDNETLLICDDVLTTGKSMQDWAAQIGINDVKGVVIFARGKCPDWVTPIFSLQSQQQEDRPIYAKDFKYFNDWWNTLKPQYKTPEIIFDHFKMYKSYFEQQEDKGYESREDYYRNLYFSLKKKVEQQEDKISDEDLERLAKDHARLHFHPEHSKDAYTACVISYKNGFKACLQKGSEDKIDWSKLKEISDEPQKWLEMYDAYSEMLTQEDVAGWWQEQFIICDKERSELKSGEDKIEKAIEVLKYFVKNGRANYALAKHHSEFDKMQNKAKTFLQSL